VLKTFWAILGWCVCSLWVSVHAADNYSLADGSTLTGDIVTFNDSGVIFRLAGEKYTDRMAWTLFSQEGLQQLAQNPKIKPLVDPFMELPPTDRVRPAEDIQIQEPVGIPMPPQKSLLGGLATSSVGLFLLFLIYATNLYAAYEVAGCRGRPLGTVLGLSAVLPVVGPAIFFLMPTNVIAPVTTITTDEAALAAPAQTFTAGPAAPEAAPSEGDIQVSAVSIGTPPPSTASQSFKRGQFTFNRRFFETKFAGFFHAARSEADQNLEFTVKTPTNVLVVRRIARLGQNDIHLEVLQGGQVQEVAVAFADIQELNLKPKTA
jgi:hypothetical protein